jgi:hypothetical protein
VTSGHQEQQIGKGRTIRQAWGQRMTGEVVHTDKGLSCCRSQTLCTHDPCKDAPDEAGPGCHRNRIDLLQGNVCPVQCLFHGEVNLFGMGAGGDLWHDAPECRMQRVLAQDNIRQNVCPAGDRCGCIVARAF